MLMRAMGVHILCDPDLFSEDDIRKLYGIPTPEAAEKAYDKKEMENRKKNPHLYALMNEKFDEQTRSNAIRASLERYKVKRHDGGWSVYDGEISARTIRRKTAMISKKTEKKFPGKSIIPLYTASFSPVDFSMAVYRNGEPVLVLERQPFHTDVPVFSWEEMACISKQWHIPQDVLPALCAAETPVQMCRAFQDRMGIPPYIEVQYENGGWKEAEKPGD